jgi:outer membrane protein assembly factor BamB
VVWERNVGFQHTSCGDFPNGDAGVTGSAVLDRATNRVFVPGGDGKLYAFDMGTGTSVAGWPTPVFTTAPRKLHDYGALTLDTTNHRIYVTLASFCDFTPYKGAVVSFDSTTGAAKRQFVVVKNTQSGGGIWGWGGASLDALQNVFVTTGNAMPDGATEATPYAEYALKLSPTFALLGAHHPKLYGNDSDFGSTPTLIDVPGCAPMLAAENKNGHLYVYRRDNLKAGPLQNLTMATTGHDNFLGLPAFDPATGTLFVTTPAGGPYGHGMVARRFGAGCTSSPLWQAAAGPAVSPVSSPTIANGVVYYADGIGQTVHAFDTDSGAELWHSAAGAITGDVFSAPLVFDGRVFVSSRSGTLDAFAPPQN